MACVHDLRSGQKGHIDANGVIEGKPAEGGRGVNWAGSYCNGFAVGGIRAEFIGEWRRRGGLHVCACSQSLWL